MNIYCWWTGDNPLTQKRKECLQQLKKVSECNVVLITKDTLNRYILPNHPLHKGYKYLSETQKGDYLKAYFMNFYGGGYTDIKKTTGSWIKSFQDLKNSNCWIVGYKEIPNGVAYEPISGEWSKLVGNGAYICKPETSITKEWYTEMMSLLDQKLEALIRNPAKHPCDSKGSGSGYPIEWNELNGRIFHKVSYKYKDRLLNTLPISVFNNYQ